MQYSAQKALTLSKHEKNHGAKCVRRENGKGWGQIVRQKPNNTELSELSKEFKIYSTCNGNCLDGCKKQHGMIWFRFYWSLQWLREKSMGSRVRVGAGRWVRMPLLFSCSMRWCPAPEWWQWRRAEVGSVRAYVEEGTDILDKGWGGGRERELF